MSHKKDELEVPGINAVLGDLENEHKRWKDRKDRLVASTQKKDDVGYQAQLAFLDMKLDYVELLIRRYTDWK